jgi:hypothetical protein
MGESIATFPLGEVARAGEGGASCLLLAVFLFTAGNDHGEA